MRLDGVDSDNPHILIDRKFNVTTFKKQIADIRRVHDALEQNPGFTLRIEVPNMKAFKNAMRLIDRAELMNSNLISVRIVPWP